jgi:DNA sulfur modification protein DndC
MGNPTQHSAFTEIGFKSTVDALCEEIRTLYLADNRPWIVGYSGGKDSTATLQLAWKAIEGIEPSKRKKIVHVVSTDTLVENPVVASWVTLSLNRMLEAAKDKQLPFSPNRLTPAVQDSFWVNLIGKGYPTPRHKFRWCTERLKIRPSNNFIMSVVKDAGEAILLLGARKQESQARAKVMARNEKNRVLDRLSPNSTLPGCSIYTPVEDWSNDDIWTYLTQSENPWGHDNKELLGMYAGASPDGECPLVVDSNTPSCGDSRFGCWVCTLVEKDKSMSAMIQNDQEKRWMKPMLDLRNALDFRTMEDPSHPLRTQIDSVKLDYKTLGADEKDHALRDFRRMRGNVSFMKNGDPVPGPYTRQSREAWLKMLLEAQTIARELGPESIKGLELITLPELHEIRRIWVLEKHELEDTLPQIYEKCTGSVFPGLSMDDSMGLKSKDFTKLKEICADDTGTYELIRELIGVENSVKFASKRSKLLDDFEKTFKKYAFANRKDASSFHEEQTLFDDDDNKKFGIVKEDTNEENPEPPLG